MTYVEGKIERVRPQQFHETVGLEDWRVLSEGACAYFRAGSLAVGAMWCGSGGRCSAMPIGRRALRI